MPLLHDTERRATLRARVESLRADMHPNWGRMSVDQMLWHVNAGLEMSLGRGPVAHMRPALGAAILRFFVLSLPWPKGARTAPELVATGTYDFDAERARCLALIDEFVAKRMDDAWPRHPSFGGMSGRQQSAFQSKHLDHHLTQFGV